MKKHSLLGDVQVAHTPFKGLDTLFKEFEKEPFTSLSFRKKFRAVNQKLLNLIKKEKEPCFLLPQVIDFIDRVNKAHILQEPYRFSSFEFWLNRFSNLTPQENLDIRSKIVGKKIPREEYHIYFPISMDKSFFGAHFVAAHASPDVDTTIASFWGWVDAFASRVAETQHHWSLPGPLPNSHFSLFFQNLFGPALLQSVARSASTLTLSAMDLVSQRDLAKIDITSDVCLLERDIHSKAIILVDEEGYFIGDWRSSDAEQVYYVSMLFASLIRWFESLIHRKLINVFAKKTIHLNDIKKALLPLFEAPLSSSELLESFSSKNITYVDDYLKKILFLEKGLETSFLELWEALDPLTDKSFSSFFGAFNNLFQPKIFDENECLVEDRPKIFALVEKIITRLDQLVFKTRAFIDKLSVRFRVKAEVLRVQDPIVSLKSDVEEIKAKIDSLNYITVVAEESAEKVAPIGVIHADDLKRSVLGTCSLRDFSNPHETKMASYLEVISVIDHHKIELQTSSAPCFHITDAQSSNTILAQLALELNNRYSMLGLDNKKIENDISKMKNKLKNTDDIKQLLRLLQLKVNSLDIEKNYIHSNREFTEYYCFLYAILDDTDLLSKVSTRDVRCVAELLNRMKSLSIGQDTAIISLDDIPKDRDFAKKAASRILQHEDMYSIYKQIYEHKEQEMESILACCGNGNPSTFFIDTKEQNGCCRVGQSKIFPSNYALFNAWATKIRELWYNEAKKILEVKSHLDFHLHMISTIAGAKEVYKGLDSSAWDHEDEMWLFVPETQHAKERLIHFLNVFHTTPSMQNNTITVEFPGSNWQELSHIFEENFPEATQIETTHQGLPIAILRYKPGSLNSRKAQVSPFLPRLIN